MKWHVTHEPMRGEIVHHLRHGDEIVLTRNPHSRTDSLDITLPKLRTAASRLNRGRLADLQPYCVMPDGRVLGWRHVLAELDNLRQQLMDRAPCELITDAPPTLLALRQVAGLKQREFAELAGVPRWLYCEIESGRKRAMLDVAARIASAFQREVSEISFPIPPRGGRRDE